MPEPFTKHPCLTKTLTGPVHPNYCQSCSRRRVDILDSGDFLTLWVECDDYDRPDASRKLVLCSACDRTDATGKPLPSGAKGKGGVIDRHPRLYHLPTHNAPVIGAMPQCGACKHRSGLSCTNPQSKSNGGPGMPIGVSNMSHLYYGGGKGAWVFNHPPGKCSGFEESEEVPL